jgi:pimeloyl-ACP methyl ester carboxylesterase
VTARPFHRLPFDELPERPRVPHDFARTRGVDRTMRSRPFGEMKVHYREMGPAPHAPAAGESSEPNAESAPPLLLVHGLMTSSYSFRYVFGPLAKRWRVIAPDLPGAGRSDKPRAESYGPEALAEWLGEFQRELGIEGCCAVGNSLGGYLCLVRAMREPKAFAKLVDVHSPASPDFRYRALGAALSLPGSRGLLRALVGRDGRKWAHENVHYYDESLKSLEEAEEYAAPLRTDEGLDAFRRYLKETLRPSGFAALARDLAARPFPVPLLLLYATTDPMVPPRNGPYLAKLVPAAKLVMLERTSHFMHVDTPDAVVDAVNEFFCA